MLWTHQEIRLEKTIFNKRIVTIFLSAVPFTNHILLLNEKLISLHPRNQLRSLPACQHHIATKANPELCEDAPDHPDGSVAACLTPPPNGFGEVCGSSEARAEGSSGAHPRSHVLYVAPPQTNATARSKLRSSPEKRRSLHKQTRTKSAYLLHFVGIKRWP